MKTTYFRADVRPAVGIWRHVCLLAVILMLGSAAPVQAAPPQKLLTVLAQRGQHTKFLSMVSAAGLTSTLDGAGPFTIFAPTDAAYDTFPTLVISNLIVNLTAPTNQALLKGAIQFHVASGQVTAASLGVLSKLPMTDGSQANITSSSGQLKINHARITQAGIAAANGTIHVIDAVLVPPNLAATVTVAHRVRIDGRFTTLTLLLDQGGYSDPGLNRFIPRTLFAPTDAAFAKLPASTVSALFDPANVNDLFFRLNYLISRTDSPASVLSVTPNLPTVAEEFLPVTTAGGLKVGGAAVVEADLKCLNGWIHAIDTFITRPSLLETQTAYDFLKEDPNFSTMVEIFEATGFGDVLRQRAASLTVFAPPNSSWAKLNPAVLKVLKDPTYRNVTVYYAAIQIVQPRFLLETLNQFFGGGTVATTYGTPVTVGKSGSTYLINGVPVTTPNILTTNGNINFTAENFIKDFLPMDIDIRAVLEADGRFTKWLQALRTAGLESLLASNDPASFVTVVAPTDTGINALPPGAFDNLLRAENRASLELFVRKHLVPGTQRSSRFNPAITLTTLAGTPLTFQPAGGGFTAGGVPIVTLDEILANEISATNGVIHAIQSVLPGTVPSIPVVPPVISALRQAGQFGTFLAAIDAAGISNSIGASAPTTIFAPSDAAFAALPAGTVDNLLKPQNKQQLLAILNYMQVAGRRPAADLATVRRLQSLQGQNLNVIPRDGALFINTAALTRPDIVAGEGIIHGINQVLFPPPVPETRNAIDMLAGDGRFTLLLTALSAAGYTDLVRTNKNLTLLAPTDEAFAAGPPGKLENLLLPENVLLLRDQLDHHMLSGQRLAASFVNGLPVNSLAVVPHFVTVEGGALRFSGGLVIDRDLATGSCLIQVLDTVIYFERQTNPGGDPIVTKAGLLENGRIRLDWTGGKGSYVIQRKATLEAPWTTFAETGVKTFDIDPIGKFSFFRVTNK